MAQCKHGIQDRVRIAWKPREEKPIRAVHNLSSMGFQKKSKTKGITYFRRPGPLMSWDSLKRIRSSSLGWWHTIFKSCPELSSFFGGGEELPDGCNYYKIISSGDRMLFSTAACHHLMENENVPGPALLFPSNETGKWSAVRLENH